MERTTTSLVRVIEEIAATRGINGLEELVERVEEAGGELTVEELYDWPRGYYGDELDKALRLDGAERKRIVRGWCETFFAEPWQKAGKRPAHQNGEAR